MHLRPRRISGTSAALLFVLLATGLNSIAQQHPNSNLYRRKTDSIAAARHGLVSDTVVENRLVALALQAPRYDAAGHLINVSKSQLSLARRAWFNLLTVSVNYNDQTFAKQQANAAYVYPKYFFGLTVPIGLFFTMGPQVHAAREQVKIAEDNQEELARTIRMDILTKYHTYKNYEALILLQNTIVVDNQAAVTQIEQKFRDGTVSIDQYNSANKAFSDEKARLLNLQLAQDLVRLDIERMIGTSFDSVIR
ncbi:MAG TPA: TolC family protein [Puia sp.]|jgi:outer membrane protein TolC|nr:TolC family protein [Puia sp.]